MREHRTTMISPITTTKPNTLLVSCVFGNIIKTVYNAVPTYKCVLFSNNFDIKTEAEEKGWDFMFVESHKLSYEYKISSMQAKYIKFLQFFDEFPRYRNATEIIYFDHKFKVLQCHADILRSIFLDCKSILIRNTPRIKTSIQDEIDDAMGQDRYVVAMDKTLTWIERTVDGKKFTMSNRIMNTGLIVYRNIDRVRPLLDSTYRIVWDLGQPECQIIWGVLSQEYEDRIQRIEWGDLDLLWQAPT
jgi:hypothetical protein